VEKVRSLKGPNGLNAGTASTRTREGRRHRRREGDALGAAERSLDRRAVPHHRGVVADKPEKEAAPAMPGGDMGGMGGMDF